MHKTRDAVFCHHPGAESIHDRADLKGGDRIDNLHWTLLGKDRSCQGLTLHKQPGARLKPRLKIG